MLVNRRQILRTALAATAGAASGGRLFAQPASTPTQAAMALEAKEALWEGGAGTSARIPAWAYNGAIPGPVLRIRQGEALGVRLLNGLQQDTSVHWRGVRGPNAMDGVAGLTQPGVKPGESFTYRFTPPDSGVFFYHAHPAEGRAEQVHRGLSGVLIVEETNPPEADEEIILALADWRMAADGRLAEPADDPADARGPGRLGSLLTINGRVAPIMRSARPGARLRFRIVNLCPARIVALTFEGAQPTIAGIDGQPCGAFDPVDRTVPAGPGSRFDVFANMPAKEGESLRLVLHSWPLAGQQAEPARAVLAIRAAGPAVAPRKQPVSLAENPALPKMIALQAARRIDMTLARHEAARNSGGPAWTINAKPLAGLPDQPLFSVKKGTPVTIAFHNRDRFPQVMRVHGHVLRLLHPFDDGWDPYWRDAVIVPPGKTVRVAFLADNPGKWLLASGIHAHANAGLSHWFEID